MFGVSAVRGRVAVSWCALQAWCRRGSGLPVRSQISCWWKILPRPKKNFSPEFRDEAVKIVIETSRPIARVAKELGINEGTLGNWAGIYRREHAGEDGAAGRRPSAPGCASSRQAETRELKMENEFLKKAASLLRPRPSVTDRVRVHRPEYAVYQESDVEHVPSIVKMCRWMDVSRSGFYEWRNAPESATAKRRRQIIALIVAKSFDESDGTYGYRRVHADLAAWGV